MTLQTNGFSSYTNNISLVVMNPTVHTKQGTVGKVILAYTD